MTNLYISEILFDSKAKDIDFSQYPFSLPVVKNLSKIKLESNITFFVGENGTGKSTLLEAVATNYGFNSEGGSKNFTFHTQESHSNLFKHILLSKGAIPPKDGYFFRAESFYNVATDIEKMDSEPSFDLKIIEAYGGTSLHKQSHGESFLSLILNRFF